MNSSRRSHINELSTFIPKNLKNTIMPQENIYIINGIQKTEKNLIDTKKLTENTQKQQKNILFSKNNQNQKNLFALNSFRHPQSSFSHSPVSSEQFMQKPAIPNVSSPSSLVPSSISSSSSASLVADNSGILKTSIPPSITHVDTPRILSQFPPLTSHSSILSVETCASEAKQDFSQLLIPITMYVSGQEIFTLAMLDSGASGSFVNESFVDRHKISTKKKSIPNEVQLIDGSLISSGPIKQETLPIRVSIGHHSETMSFDIVNLGKYPLLLGIDWLLLHNPIINWKNKSIQFSNCFCLRNFTSNSVFCYFSNDLIPSKFTQNNPENFLFVSPFSIFSLSTAVTSYPIPPCYNQFKILFSEQASSTLPTGPLIIK